MLSKGIRGITNQAMIRKMVHRKKRQIFKVIANMHKITKKGHNHIITSNQERRTIITLIKTNTLEVMNKTNLLKICIYSKIIKKIGL